MTVEIDPRRRSGASSSPVERLEALCDRGSLTLLRSDVRSRRMGEKARAGDGVIAGAGRVDGRPVFCYAQDPSYLGGSLGEQHADSIVKVLRLAGRAGAPVVGFIESGGARMQEGTRRARRLRADLPRARRAERQDPADLRDLRRVGRRRLLLARADRLRDHDRAREHVPHRPRGRPRGHGRGRQRRRARRLQGPRAQRRRALRRRRRRRRRAARPRPARPPARQPRRARAAVAPGRPGRLRRRRAGARRTSAASTTCATSSAAWSTAAACSSGAPRWARNIVCGFARMDGRAGRRGRQPAAATWAACSTPSRPPRARASCAPATRSACRSSCWSTRPGFMPGTKQEQSRRDPPRRQARARVRRGDACRR